MELRIRIFTWGDGVMSVVIGYVSEYFSIVMTDTRITYGKNAEMGWDDNVEKLVSYQIWDGRLA